MRGVKSYFVVFFSFISVQAYSANNAVTVINWDELLPPLERSILQNPPESIKTIAEGSSEDGLRNKLKIESAEDKSAYQKALSSKNVVLDFQGVAVKIAGFLVPLEFTDEGKITTFFLVPYFGACMHLPPPPPNQIIFVKSKKPIDWTYDPIWVSGELAVLNTQNELAESTYSVDEAKVELY